MAPRLRIAFATCAAVARLLGPVRARFAGIAEVLPFLAAGDGSDADALALDLTQAGPHAVVAFPKMAARLVEAGVAAPVLPIEMPHDVLLDRVSAALDVADSVAVLPPAGTMTPSTTRLLRRLGNAVHILPYEDDAHLRDLVVRCRRMGVQAVVGGETLKPLAESEGLRAFSLIDRPDETAGVLGQAVMKAVALAARHVAHTDERIRLGLILEKIGQGVIGPRDIALCVDRRGRVTTAFAPPAANGAGRDLTLALRGGLSLIDAATVTARHSITDADEAGGPVPLDLYPLADDAGDGFLAVLRATPLAAPARRGDSGPPDPGDAPVTRLVERLGTLVDRTEALVRARRARRAPHRLLASRKGRTFLVDWRRVRYLELRSGVVYASLATGETGATKYTLAEVAARVDARDFFRIHRHVFVNLAYVTGIERYDASRLRIFLDGPGAPSFVVSRPASAVLRKLLEH